MDPMQSAPPLIRHPDRLFPADAGVRPIARRLFEAVADLPIVSPHGHVEASLLVEDLPFRDPTSLLITPDHYLTRLLHADGVSLADLGVGREDMGESGSRLAWQTLCEHWDIFRGTPTRYWLEDELAGIFGVDVRPSVATADAIYDQIAGCLQQETFRPRALFGKFGIEVLATTDDPCDDLDAHARLSEDPGFTGRVLPTFRPDRYLEVGAPGWSGHIDRLGEIAGIDTGSYAGWVAAMETRRAFFQSRGAVSADHSHADVGTAPLAPAEVARIYRTALGGTVANDDGVALRRHMLLEMARMSCDDGLVMTLHPGVRRNHHRPTGDRFGPDTGHDIPIAVEFTDSLRPLLQRFGTHPNLHLVLFTVDETVFSRELAPLAGFYPSVWVGAPWWFLDAPEAVRRFRSAVTETAGFSRTSGFIDDTRAFCSIPARHEMSRRLDAGYLAGLVAEHLLDEDEAHETLVYLVARLPRAVFKL